MIKKYKTPFTKTVFSKTIDAILPPEDLLKYIHLAAQIRRYKFQDQDLDHIFDDRVDEHTKRMVLYAENLSLGESEKAALIRTLWIHDIPEVVDAQATQSDMTSIDKIRYPDLAFATKKREEAVMEAIFSLEDKVLYRAFDPAKEMLFTGRIDFDKTTPVAMIARVLDNFIDGTNSFHGFVAHYLSSDAYRDALPLPQADSFEYCFQRGLDVYNHVSRIEHPEYITAKKVILDILHKDFFGFVEEIWSPIALERMPDYARSEYEKYLTKLSRIDFSK
jgi:5'-deoxynucleotidase YfbR-like HD superfamily hydrolase